MQRAGQLRLARESAVKALHFFSRQCVVQVGVDQSKINVVNHFVLFPRSLAKCEPAAAAPDAATSLPAARWRPTHRQSERNPSVHIRKAPVPPGNAPGADRSLCEPAS